MENDYGYIYECGCGNTTFELRRNGEVECAVCEHRIDGITVTFVEGIPVAGDGGPASIGGQTDP